jgi:hypothetical protein
VGIARVFLGYAEAAQGWRGHKHPHGKLFTPTPLSAGGADKEGGGASQGADFTAMTNTA